MDSTGRGRSNAVVPPAGLTRKSTTPAKATAMASKKAKTPVKATAKEHVDRAATPSVAVTPASNGRKRKAPLSIAAKDHEVEVATPGLQDAPETTPKRKRKGGYTPSEARPIPRTYEECEDYDKMLLEMREAGNSWKTIREHWEEMTGDDAKNSTLPNRYDRLMNNLSRIEDEDKPKLIIAKQQVEDEFEQEQWSKIATRMHEDGAQLYDGEVLRRQHKQLMLLAETLPPIGKAAKKKAAKGDKGKEGDWVDEDED